MDLCDQEPLLAGSSVTVQELDTLCSFSEESDLRVSLLSAQTLLQNPSASLGSYDPSSKNTLICEQDTTAVV